nr:uncharacterized protein K02A2.6-like [Misgurnus anguillicaudatus]
MALLLHCLGTEGQRLFYTLPDTGDTLDSAMAALQTYFNPKINVVAERHSFRKRAQAPSESVLQYVAALRDLVSKCEFGANTDDMIRDQLIEHVASHRIRERLLLETDLTLTKAITIATQIEAAAEQAKSIAGNQPLPVQTIQSRSKDTSGRRRRTPSRKPPNTSFGSGAVSSTSRTCFRCGSDKHLANAQHCPASQVKCKKCQKIGHFARVCRSSESRAVHEVALPEYTVLYMHDLAATNRIECPVYIKASTATIEVALMVDTGSSVSILPKSIYDANFSSVPLQSPTANLVTYSRAPIPVLGCLPATVSRDDVTCSAKFYIVDSGTALLGMDLIKGLRLRFEGQRLLPALTHAKPQASSSAVRCLTKTASPQRTLGCAKGFVHKVKLAGNTVPVRQKLRRLPLSVRSAVSNELDRLLKEGIIEKIDASPWVSPIVVTLKKTGGIRLCVDLREPNKAIVTDSYPLPHMDELLSSLTGATLFSTVDLQSAYHQVMLHPDSRDLTSFITHDGLFRFCRVPYGLASAPSAFQKMMCTILQDLPNVANYLDDIIIWGRTPEEHERSLQGVMQRLRDAGLQINESKCHFRQTSLQFLGHTVTAQGIQPDKQHLCAILQAPAPTDAVQLRSFLGLLSWYSKFIPNFASVVEPLRACLRKDAEFRWSNEAQDSFSEVRQLLVNSPALALYNPDLPTIISTDASDYGLGAVFSQIHPDKSERTVAFASRTLTTPERKYSTVEKEALACVWAVEKWRTYLWGRTFTLRTDHQALTTLLTTKGGDRAGMRIARWSARLLCFNYEVQYRPGCHNSTADCLSRLPLPSEATCPDSDIEPEQVALLTSALTAVTPEEFATASASCPEMCALRAQIQKGWPRSSSHVDPLLLPFYKLRNELAATDDLILKGSRLVAPALLRHRLVMLAHEGHQGIVRTKQRLRDLYWWPRMDESVTCFISSCQLCQVSDKTAKLNSAPLQPVPFPAEPWRKVAMDVVGPFESATWDCRYALTLIDYHSKWPEVAFVSSVSASQVVNFLTSVFSRHGNPECIVTDNGPQFTAAEFSAFLKSRDIDHVRTPVYHPAANGAIERFHRVLKSCIQSAIIELKPWKMAVTEFLHVYRATPHFTTGVTPFELLHGRKMRTRLDVLAPLTSGAKARTGNSATSKNEAMV